MIPLTLITGFLGSGKTTLLRQLIARYRERRLVYLVNEFGSIDVDGQLLALPADQLVSIPGGSIFCRCLAGEFVHALTRIATLPAGPPEGVIIEASGMANPKVIGMMLEETKLGRAFELRHIIAIVEPGSFLKLIHTLPNIISQVEACDLAVINKIDQYAPEQVAQVEHFIRERNAEARILHTTYCEMDCDVLAADLQAGPLARCRDGKLADCVDPNYITRTLHIEEPVSLQSLLNAILALQPAVYRVKGFVPTLSGFRYVDVSHGGITMAPVAAHAITHQDLVIIAGPQATPAIDEFARAVTSIAS